MSQERRSLYRILHVQPEAPPEIITAAYRCLMTKLKCHPDRGGDHDTAVRINQAYAVLSNASKRRLYDDERKVRQSGRQGTRPSAPASSDSRICPFCSASLPRAIVVGTRCTRCSSPLSAIAHQIKSQPEVVGRRRATRFSKNIAGTVQAGPTRRPAAARLRDISITGVSFFTALELKSGNNVRLIAPGIDLVAHVISTRLRDRIYLVHAQVLTANFDANAGVFVSVSA